MKKRDHEGLKSSDLNENTPNGSHFPIIAVGGSAGAIEAFKELVRGLTDDIGMAIIYILHLDPDHPSDLARIISKETSIEVVSAENGDRLRPNCIFIMPPNVELRLNNYVMELSPRDKKRTPFLPVDSFLISLASTPYQSIIAIILSGLGSDGCLGVKEIGSVGGLVFAQSAESSENFSMPASAIETGYVDFVLSPSKIAEEIVNIKKYPLLNNVNYEQNKEGVTQLEKIFFMIKKHMNIDFANYKRATIKRRIQRRMIILKKESIEDYIEYLLLHADEIELLCQDLLIGVTNFFRDPEVFEVLKKEVFLKILQDNIDNYPIRIWVPACSTGEEAYSIAIALIELLGEDVASTQIQIFATDVSEKSIKTARMGYYWPSIEKEVSKQRLNRFFIKTDQGYQISKFIREICIFAVQNVITDPPFSRMDLISCRNLLIYFDSNLQKKVFASFHYSLKPKGYLLLGNSETVGRNNDLYKSLNKKYKIYQKRKLGKSLAPLSFITHREKEKIKKEATLQPSMLIDEKQVIRYANQIILDKLCPVSVIIKEDFNILQIKGDATYFLAPPAGATSYNLLKMAKEELRTPLRLLLAQASEKQIAMNRSDIPLKFTNLNLKVEIFIYPFSISADERKYFVVTFSQKQVLEDKKIDLDNIDSETNHILVQKDKEIKHLEQQLNETREHLKIVISENETTNESLRTLNEEILSNNEELQSTNEELQTSKEEVQSSNEELRTLNDELQVRNLELVQLLDDINNLLSTIQIPIVIIDLKLCIRRITSSANKGLGFLATDIGRSVLDNEITKTIENFEEKIKNVMTNDVNDHVEICDRSGYWYSVKMIPFKNFENEISGAIISFYDIQTEKLARQKQTELATVMDITTDAISIMDLEGSILSWNQGAQKQYGYSADEALKMNIDDFIPTDLKQESLELRRKISEEGFIKSAYSKRITKSGETLDVWLTGTVIKDTLGKPIQITISERDMSEQVLKEELVQRQKEMAVKANIRKTSFLANMSHEIRTPLSAIIGFSELLEIQQDLSPPKRDSYLQKIQQSGKHLSDLIDDILDLTKIEAGQLQIENVSFLPRQEIKKVMDSCIAIAQKNEIEIKVEYQSDIPEEIFSDPTRIRQILFNLIGNSIKFTKSGEVLLFVKFEKKSSRLFFNVKDTGCGIKADKKDIIFDPFIQADDSMSRQYGGTGLGLGLSRKLTELMGGELYLVESEIGVGSTFEFYIPIVHSDINQIENSQASPAFMKKKVDQLEGLLDKMSVLVVEDGIDNQILFTNILELAGASVKVIDNGLSAFNEAKENDYDVILMDIQIPEMEGKEVTAKLRKEGYKGPIIGITAHAFKEDKQKALDAGLNDYKTKPIAAEELIKLVHDWVIKKQKD